jgi:hypothetical protein
MLISSKKTGKSYKIVVGTTLLVVVLILLKVLIQNNPEFIGMYLENNPKADGLETPSSVESNLYTQNLLASDKNKIYQKENFSLYLNKVGLLF